MQGVGIGSAFKQLSYDAAISMFDGYAEGRPVTSASAWIRTAQ